MLQAGGIPLLTDGVRLPDADNPNGYFELEAVKRLAGDAAWLAQAAGRAIKIVVPLILHLPAGLGCRVLFMERDLNEVIASQTAMLRRKGRSPTLPADRLTVAFQSQVQQAKAFLNQRPDTGLLILNHRELIGQPEAAARRISSFLGRALDIEAMTARVNPDLYRQRET